MRPRKGLGQNFLRDPGLARKIVEAAHIHPSDTVVEVGPGTGSLTHLLAREAQRLIAVELDPALAALLRAGYSHDEQVRVWEGDALQFDPCREVDGPYVLIGNIPYYITGPLLRHFLETACRPLRAVLMVQREVAERVVARPPHMSLLSVSVQAYGEPRLALRVPRGAFYPMPKVDSAVLVITPHSQPVFGYEGDAFFRVARAGFGTKRKQLTNALSLNLPLRPDEARSLLRDAGIEGARRAETLTLEEWNTLARLWRERYGP